MIIDLKCENCKKKFKLDMSKGKKGHSVKCKHCGATYNFTDDGFKKVDDALKNFGKNSKFK